MKFLNDILPILQWLPQYKSVDLKGDLFAGITVGVMLIPQGMAYALIAGLPPVYGLYASIVPQLMYAVFGTSRQLSVAPVAMDSLLVATGVSVIASEGTTAYISYCILVAFWTGAFQMLLGIFRMGFITNLLSKPVISGFTSAAAIIIGFNQLKYLVGVDIQKSNRFYEVVWSTIKTINEIHIITILIGVGGIVLIKVIGEVNKSIPRALIVVVLGTSIVYFLNLFESGVSIVGIIPSGLPSFAIPNFSLGQLGRLLPLSITISVVAFMESYSVSKAIESKRRNYKVVANQELISLGIANLVGSFFQAYHVTGGFSRSAVNDQSGANTPLSSIISAGIVTIALLFLTPLFYYLPKAILASIIMVAVSSLVDLGYIKRLWKESKIEFGLLLVTLLITINIGMVVGIVSGIILSILILLYRAAYPHIAILGRLKGRSEFRNIKRFNDLEVWEDKFIIRVDAALTFINIQYIKDFLEDVAISNTKIKIVIIDASSISYLDATATVGLQELVNFLKKKNVDLMLTDLIGPVRDVLFKTGLLKEIGVNCIFLSLNDAIENSKMKESDDNQKRALQHGLLTEE